MNLGNYLGDRSSVRINRWGRMQESGDQMKSVIYGNHGHHDHGHARYDLPKGVNRRGNLHMRRHMSQPHFINAEDIFREENSTTSRDTFRRQENNGITRVGSQDHILFYEDVVTSDRKGLSSDSQDARSREKANLATKANAFTRFALKKDPIKKQLPPGAFGPGLPIIGSVQSPPSDQQSPGGNPGGNQELPASNPNQRPAAGFSFNNNQAQPGVTGMLTDKLGREFAKAQINKKDRNIIDRILHQKQPEPEKKKYNLDARPEWDSTTPRVVSLTTTKAPRSVSPPNSFRKYEQGLVDPQKFRPSMVGVDFDPSNDVPPQRDLNQHRLPELEYAQQQREMAFGKPSEGLLRNEGVGENAVVGGVAADGIVDFGHYRNSFPTMEQKPVVATQPVPGSRGGMVDTLTQMVSPRDTFPEQLRESPQERQERNQNPNNSNQRRNANQNLDFLPCTIEPGTRDHHMSTNMNVHSEHDSNQKRNRPTEQNRFFSVDHNQFGKSRTSSMNPKASNPYQRSVMMDQDAGSRGVRSHSLSNQIMEKIVRPDQVESRKNPSSGYHSAMDRQYDEEVRRKNPFGTYADVEYNKEGDRLNDRYHWRKASQGLEGVNIRTAENDKKQTPPDDIQTPRTAAKVRAENLDHPSKVVGSGFGAGQGVSRNQYQDYYKSWQDRVLAVSPMGAWRRLSGSQNQAGQNQDGKPIINDGRLNNLATSQRDGVTGKITASGDHEHEHHIISLRDLERRGYGHHVPVTAKPGQGGQELHQNNPYLYARNAWMKHEMQKTGLGFNPSDRNTQKYVDAKYEHLENCQKNMGESQIKHYQRHASAPVNRRSPPYAQHDSKSFEKSGGSSPTTNSSPRNIDTGLKTPRLVSEKQSTAFGQQTSPKRRDGRPSFGNRGTAYFGSPSGKCIPSITGKEKRTNGPGPDCNRSSLFNDPEEQKDYEKSLLDYNLSIKQQNEALKKAQKTGSTPDTTIRQSDRADSDLGNYGKMKGMGDMFKGLANQNIARDAVNPLFDMVSAGVPSIKNYVSPYVAPPTYLNKSYYEYKQRLDAEFGRQAGGQGLIGDKYGIAPNITEVVPQGLPQGSLWNPKKKPVDTSLYPKTGPQDPVGDKDTALARGESIIKDDKNNRAQSAQPKSEKSDGGGRTRADMSLPPGAGTAGAGTAGGDYNSGDQPQKAAFGFSFTKRLLKKTDDNNITAKPNQVTHNIIKSGQAFGPRYLLDGTSTGKALEKNEKLYHRNLVNVAEKITAATMPEKTFEREEQHAGVRRWEDRDIQVGGNVLDKIVRRDVSPNHSSETPRSPRQPPASKRTSPRSPANRNGSSKNDTTRELSVPRQNPLNVKKSVNLRNRGEVTGKIGDISGNRAIDYMMPFAGAAEGAVGFEEQGFQHRGSQLVPKLDMRCVGGVPGYFQGKKRSRKQSLRPFY